MLVKLLPEQVSKYWVGIKEAIKTALPPIVQGKPADVVLNGILTAIMDGSMSCWASCEQTDRGILVKAILTTTMTFDACSNVRCLMIYTLTALGALTRKDWEEGFAALAKDAERLGCKFISAYTQNPSITDVARKFGADIWEYIAVPLQEESK